MLVGELLANYEGKVVFFDTSSNLEVCKTTGGSPIISLLQDYEVESWKAVPSTKYPQIEVYCQFTQIPPNDETEAQPETVETVEGE